MTNSGYDDRYQLTSATYPTIPSESFGYDSVGNRTASHISPSYTYNAGNQLLEDAEFTYQCDADGNCTQRVSKLDGTRHEYIFNSENRMTGYRKYDVSSTLLTTADYFYDAVGRRMAKQVDSNLTRYINREEDIVMVLPQSSSPIFYWHGPGIDEPIASVAGDQGYFNDMGGYWTYYFLTDGLGSVREVRLHAPWQIGVLVLAPLYDSFGQILTSPPAPDSTLNLFLYTGRQLDAETGLYHLRARYYDPRAGRFTSEDPSGPKVTLQGETTYGYVRNAPLLLVDPLGLFGITHNCGGLLDRFLQFAARSADNAANNCLRERYHDWESVSLAIRTLGVQCLPQPPEHPTWCASSPTLDGRPSGGGRRTLPEWVGGPLRMLRGDSPS